MDNSIIAGKFKELSEQQKKEALSYTQQAGACFAEKLKALRKAAKLNQTELAEKLNVSRASISSYENQDRVPDIEMLYATAVFFGVSAAWLIGLSDVRKADPDLEAACKLTGLSEAAIGSLLECRSDCGNTDGINALLRGIYLPDLNTAIMNSIRLLQPLYRNYLDGFAPVTPEHPFIYDTVSVANLYNDNPTLQQQLHEVGCVLLGPDNTRHFYEQLAVEIVRDFIKEERERMEKERQSLAVEIPEKEK